MKRIPPSRRMRQEIDELLQGWEAAGHPLDNFVRLGARYMLQVALEQEVEDFLGRAHYQRGSRRKRGWRNGYEPGKAKTAEGLLDVALPQLRATEEPFRSHLALALRDSSDILGRLVTGMYVRGLSTRDVDGMFVDALGQPWKDTVAKGITRILGTLNLLIAIRGGNKKSLLERKGGTFQQYQEKRQETQNLNPGVR